MIPVVSPWRRLWPSTQAAWSAWRDQYRSAIYPSGVPTSGADSVVDPFTDTATLVNCSHINTLSVQVDGNAHGNVRYTNAQPGVGGITIQQIVEGANTPRSISVDGLIVRIHVATDGAGAVANSETANSIAAAVNGMPDAAALVAALGNISGGSNGTGLVKASWGGVALPTGPTLTSLPGMDHMRLLVFTSPGGRDDGTPIYIAHLIPSVTRINVCFLMTGGHSDKWPWWTTYAPSTGESQILRALAMGMDVLVADMPGTGLNPRPTQIVVNGSLVTLAPHAYSTLDADGGPLCARQFLDQPLRAMNQIASEYPGIRFIHSGHSGGGQTGAMIAAVDDRAIHWSELRGQCANYWRPKNTDNIGVSDQEENRSSEAYRNCQWDYSGQFALAAGVSGRRSMFVYGDIDTTFPGVVPERAGEWASGLNDAVSCLGASCTVHKATTYPPTNHMPTIAEVAAWETDVKEHLGIS